MKQFDRICFSFLICWMVLFQSSCTKTTLNTSYKTSKAISDTIDFNKEKYFSDLTELDERLDELQTLLENEDFENLVDLILATRVSFQKIGFLMEYLDVEIYNLFNGAPVWKENVASPNNSIDAPRGLQVVYELSEQPVENKASLISEIKFLKYQLKYFRSWLSNLDIGQQQIINAAFLQLIRIETLTIVGFDAPDFDAAQQEFITQMEILHHYLSSIFSEKLKTDLPIVANDFENKLQLSDYINQHKIQLTPLTTDHHISPIDFSVANIYSPSFLETSFYSSYGMVENEEVRKIELGKKLFQDKMLSQAGQFSCATCHQPNQFFTDGLKLSDSNLPGISLLRNTPTVLHAAYQEKYMYDGRANSLEDQMLHVFNHPKEFKSSIGMIVNRLEKDSMYLTAFDSIYQNNEPNTINIYTLTDVLASYVRSLTSHNSTFDLYKRKETHFIDEAVKNGFNLFMGKAECGTCHFAPTFSGLLPPYFEDSELENIGVPVFNETGAWIIDSDVGRYNFYPNEVFKHFFKTPSIRNVAMTAPYMHNGVFETLEEVMDFYNNGGGVGHGLNYKNQTLPSDSLGLTKAEITNIITFMEALTDSSYFQY